jgi:DNA-binding beta-propeller fold protein YncE
MSRKLNRSFGINILSFLFASILVALLAFVIEEASGQPGRDPRAPYPSYYFPIIAKAPVTPSPTPVPLGNVNGMISDAARNRLFVAGYLNNSSFSVFDEVTGGLSQSANVSLNRLLPFGVGMYGNKVYFANWGGQFDPASVSVISATALTKIKDIAINACGGQAAHLAVNPATARVYVALHAGVGAGQVAVINAISDTLVQCVPTNTGAFGVAVHPASNSIFVSNRDGLDLWRIDGATFTATRVIEWRTPTGGGSPYYVSVSPSTNKLFVVVGLPSSDIPNKLYVYNIDALGNLSNERIVAVGNTGDGGYVLQSQSNCPAAPNLIFIAAQADNAVWVLNSDLSVRSVLTATKGIGVAPYALAENVALKQVYVSNKGSHTFTILNACAP